MASNEPSLDLISRVLVAVALELSSKLELESVPYKEPM